MLRGDTRYEHRRRLGCVTDSGDWGWFVAVVRIEGLRSFRDGERFGMSEWWSLPEWSILGTEDGLWEDLEWHELLDGLNDLKVSKGVLSYSYTRHHLDEDQCLTTTSRCITRIRVIKLPHSLFHQQVSPSFRSTPKQNRYLLHLSWWRDRPTSLRINPNWIQHPNKMIFLCNIRLLELKNLIHNNSTKDIWTSPPPNPCICPQQLIIHWGELRRRFSSLKDSLAKSL